MLQSSFGEVYMRKEINGEIIVLSGRDGETIYALYGENPAMDRIAVILAIRNELVQLAYYLEPGSFGLDGLSNLLA